MKEIDERDREIDNLIKQANRKFDSSVKEHFYQNVFIIGNSFDLSQIQSIIDYAKDVHKRTGYDGFIIQGLADKSIISLKKSILEEIELKLKNDK